MGAGHLTVAMTLLLATGASCAGPRPDLSAPRISGAGASGATVRVEAELHNPGGAGDVKITARVTDRSGRSFVASRTLPVEARETIQVVVDVPAPPGDYVARISAAYPPD